MKIELCDLCELKEPNKRFKIKMSSRGSMESVGCCMEWNDKIWNPYKKIVICEDCAEKLFGIKSSATIRKEVFERMGLRQNK